MTTAATLWLVTVIGLCLGGGEIGLGIAATALGMLALWVLKWLENCLYRERRARLSIEFTAGGPSEAELRSRLSEAGWFIERSALWAEQPKQRRRFVFEVHHLRRAGGTEIPMVVQELGDEPNATHPQWRDLA